jgi:hypothetical protein
VNIESISLRYMDSVDDASLLKYTAVGIPSERTSTRHPINLVDLDLRDFVSMGGE